MFTKVRVDMTIDEINKVSGLLERDVAKPCIRVKTKIGKKDFQYDKCPVCDEVVVSGADFCTKCGQRLDKENIEF